MSTRRWVGTGAVIGSFPPDLSSPEYRAADLYVLGAGVRLYRDLTLETIDVLKQCRAVFTNLSPDMQDWLARRLGCNLRTLLPLYEAGRPRREGYQRIVQTLLESATREPPVAYFARGSPVVFDTVTQCVIDAGRRMGLSVRLLPAVSCIDAIFAELGRDIAPALQVFDAAYMIEHRIVPSTDHQLLVLQLSVHDSEPSLETRPPCELVAPLSDYLLNFYPRSHPVAIVRVAILDGGEHATRHIQLSDFAAALEPDDLSAASLFIDRLWN